MATGCPRSGTSNCVATNGKDCMVCGRALFASTPTAVFPTVLSVNQEDILLCSFYGSV